MERDFSGRNLRGHNFKGQDLTGAKFDRADLQGANFSQATLCQASFQQAKLGVPWKFRIVAIVLGIFAGGSLYSCISSMGSGLVLSIFSPLSVLLQPQGVSGYQGLTNNLTTAIAVALLGGIASVSTISAFLWGIFRRGIVFTLGVLVVAFLLPSLPSLVSTTVNMFYSYLTRSPVDYAQPSGIAGVLLSFNIALSSLYTLWSPMIVGVLGWFTYTAARIVNQRLAMGTLVIGLVGPFCLQMLFYLFPIYTWSQDSPPELPGASGQSLLTGLGLTGVIVGVAVWAMRSLSKRTFSGDPRYRLVIRIGVAIAAIGGTCFYKADLTEADFTGASLKQGDFRSANLTRTRWHQATGLNFARPGSTYLQYPELPQVLTSGQAPDHSFDGLNLQGINFDGARLRDASFVGANLNDASFQDADLSRVILKQAQLDGANLTGATLTGAYLEDWGITRDTILQGIRCQYVYMRVPTREDPDPLRKPDNRAEVFEDGDFGEFIRPIVETLDLYHNQGIDPRAIAIAFKELAENNPDANLEIVAMEKRGSSNFLLRAKTAPRTDKSELSATYFATYNELRRLPPHKVKALLDEKDQRIQSLETMVVTALQRPSFYSHIERAETVSNNPGGIQQNITNSSVGGGIQANIGDHGQQTMTVQASIGDVPTPAEIITDLSNLDTLIQQSELPADVKQKLAQYLTITTDEVQAEDPDKPFVAKNLERMTKTLQEAEQSATSARTIVETMTPIVTKIATWIGPAAATLLALLP